MPLAEVRPIVLENQFVRLEPIAPQHEPSLREAGRDKRIWTYMLFDASTDEGMARLVREAIANSQTGNTLVYVVCLANSGRIVGTTSYLHITPIDCNLSIGWTWYAPDVWASTVNPACKLAMLSHAFETLGAVRVGLRCDIRNTRSHDATLRLGATKEGILRRHKLARDGEIRDTAQFSILDHEWPDVRAGLHRRLGID